MSRADEHHTTSHRQKPSPGTLRGTGAALRYAFGVIDEDCDELAQLLRAIGWPVE